MFASNLSDLLAVWLPGNIFAKSMKSYFWRILSIWEIEFRAVAARVLFPSCLLSFFFSETMSSVIKVAVDKRRHQAGHRLCLSYVNSILLGEREEGVDTSTYLPLSSRRL